MGTTVPDIVETLIADERSMAHLATSTDDRPHVAPVWYRYDGEAEELVIVTGGRKLENIRANPRVAVSIQNDVDGDTLWMVTLLGTARIIDDRAAFREANRKINAKYGASEDAYEENTLVRISIGTAAYRTYEGFEPPEDVAYTDGQWS